MKLKTEGELRKESLSGITIAGKTLEEVISREEANELGEMLKPDFVYPYSGKPRIRYRDTAEKHSPVRRLTRREINKWAWKEARNSKERKRTMDTANIDEAIATILLSGEEVSGATIMDHLTQRFSIDRRNAGVRVSWLFNSTDIKCFLNRRKEGNSSMYSLKSAVLDLTPKELALFAYKTSPLRKEVLANHIALSPLLETGRPVRSRAKSSSRKSGNLKSLESPQMLATSLEQTLSEALGVPVTVSGKIEIVFRLG